MRLLGFVVALFLALIGLTGVIAPDWLMTIGRHTVTPVGLCIVAALRISIGLIMAHVAPVSRAPITLRILGIIAVTAGVATVLVGTERAQAILDWWSGHGPVLLRLGAGIALIMGSFIAYALIPNHRAS